MTGIKRRLDAARNSTNGWIWHFPLVFSRHRFLTAACFVFFARFKFDENKVAWVAGLATIGAVEFMAAAVALFILRRLQVQSQNLIFPRFWFWFFFSKTFDNRPVCVLALYRAGAYVSTKPTWPMIRYLPNCLENIFKDVLRVLLVLLSTICLRARGMCWPINILVCYYYYL